MSKENILQRGLSLPLIVAMVIAMVVVAGVAMATTSADAVIGPITVIDADYDGDLDAANVAADLEDADDPTDLVATGGGLGPNLKTLSPTTLVAESLTANIGIQATGLLDSTGTPAPAGQLYRAAATGGAVDILAIETLGTAGDLTLGNDIFSVSVTLGGINAVAGPSAIVVTGGSYAPIATLNEQYGFSVFGQGVAGTSTITVSSAGTTGTTAAVAPTVQFVGEATTGTPVAPAVGAAQALGTAGVSNSWLAGTAPAYATALAAVYNVRFADTNGEPVLDGSAVQAITTFGTLSGAGFGSIAPNGLNAQVVFSDDSAGLLQGGAASLHGLVVMGIGTAAAAPGAGTLTFATISAASISSAVDFVAFGVPASATGDFLAAGAAGQVGAGPIMSAGGAVNARSTVQILVLDAGGNPVTNLTTAAAKGATVVGGAAPAGSVGIGFAVTAAPVPANGPGGVYSLDVTTTAATAAGSYDLSIGTTGASATVTLAVGGATATVEIATAAPSVGINEIVTYTITQTGADGNPVPDGTPAVLVTSLGAVAPANGVNTGPGTTVDGVGGGTLISVVASGTVTLTATSPNGIVAQTTIQFGGIAGGDPDGITDGGEVTGISNTPIALSVTISKDGEAFGAAIVRFQATGGTVAPSDVSTGPDGVAATSFQAAAGTYSVTATVFTSGPVALIPVSGLTTTFTVVVGGGELTAGAVATFLAWTAGDTTAAAAFAGAENLTVAWRWSGSAWESYAPGAPDAVNTNYSLSNGDVLFVVSTGAVTIGG